MPADDSPLSATVHTAKEAIVTYNHITAHLTKSRLDELMKRSNVSREELAKLMAVSDETLKAISDGRYDPPLSIAYKLAAALKVPVEDLYEDTAERQASTKE